MRLVLMAMITNLLLSGQVAKGASAAGVAQESEYVDVVQLERIALIRNLLLEVSSSPGYEKYRPNIDKSDELERMFERQLALRREFFLKNDDFLMPIRSLPKESNVLEVGSGIGFHSSELRKRFDTVTAVEPDRSVADFGERHGLYDRCTLLEMPLQDLPEELNGTFDSAISYLWNVPFIERRFYFRRLHMLLKSGSVFYLGMNKKAEFNDESYVSAVEESFAKYFNYVGFRDKKDQSMVWMVLRRKDVVGQ